MIIDGQAKFRSLLMHHVTTSWPDAIITAYDPVTAGRLPEEFSGAGNDVVLLGDELGGHDAFARLQSFVATPGFPPIIYFSSADKNLRDTFTTAGARAFFWRKRIPHERFVATLRDILIKESPIASTAMLFSGDPETRRKPLLRDYELVRELSINGLSALYLTTQRSSGRQLVLKVLRQIPQSGHSSAAFDYFLQEYELIAEINHPNVIQIFDLGISDEHAHIAMEYIGGGDLRSLIQAGMSEQQVIACFLQIVGALASVHAVGVLHRDLKPANVMLREDGSFVLIDFGIALKLRRDLQSTAIAGISGTPHYMSPEQGRGAEIDVRSDLYSLGVIFYEMLTGQKLYEANSVMKIIYRHAKEPIPRLPKQFIRYQNLMDKLLAKDPCDRPQSAAEVLETIQCLS